jgi:hypothetical protein
VLAALFLLAACQHQQPARSLRAGCDTVAAQPAATMDMTGLAGNYSITFFATRGLRSGHSVSGLLTLRAQDPAMIELPRADGVPMRQPYVGRLDVELDSIGAVQMGDLMTDDAAAPGFALYVAHRLNDQVTEVLGRVGSVSNARGPSPIDAGHFTLFVRRVSTQGIWGGWSSNPGTGGFITPDAVGHFCALRSSN